MDAHGQKKKAKKREKIVTIIQMLALSQVFMYFGPCKSVSHILVDKSSKPKYLDLLGAIVLYCYNNIVHISYNILHNYLYFRYKMLLQGIEK